MWHEVDQESNLGLEVLGVRRVREQAHVLLDVPGRANQRIKIAVPVLIKLVVGVCDFIQ